MKHRPHASLERFLRLSLIVCLGLFASCEQSSTTPKEQAGAAIEPAPTYSKPLILVAGVTGRQGSALARELLRLGYPVRGTTRSPNSEKAKAMAALGVDLVRADFEDMESLMEASKDVYGVFFYTPGGPKEIVMGQNITNAAIASQVKHIVYTTYLSADPANGYPGKQPKRTIENYIRSKGIGYTFFRPVSFMENYARRQSAIVDKGITGPQPPDYVTQFISVEDIAFFAADAFEKPGEWMGKELNIASDEMNQLELAHLFSEVLGQPVDYKRISWNEAAERMPASLVNILQWYETSNFKVDVSELRAQYPDLMTLERYLRTTGWENWSSEPEL